MRVLGALLIIEAVHQTRWVKTVKEKLYTNLRKVLHLPHASHEEADESSSQAADIDVSQVNTDSFDFTLLKGGKDKRAATYNQLLTTLSDLRQFLLYQLERVNKNQLELKTLRISRELLRVMEHDIQNIHEIGGNCESVTVVMVALQDYVQRVLHSLQNPVDCSRAPKIHCEISTRYGFASGVRHLIDCFTASLRTRKTVILDTSKWHYAPRNDWVKTFLPVAGPSCRGITGSEKNDPSFNGSGEAMKNRRRIMELPSTIVRPLVAHHGNPYVWWFGQILGYALRLQNATRRRIDKFKEGHGFEHPIVGIHVRRTDKLQSEAASHSIDEYMVHVDEFYEKLSLTFPVKTRRVYVATDEPSVIEELKGRYPHYKAIYNMESAKGANQPERRSKMLFDVVSDLHLLAECDFLVCTLSSGFCRIAYELMQAQYPEASHRVVSVDVDHFFAYIASPPWKTLHLKIPTLRDELGWSTAGSLLERPSDRISEIEARYKKYADGFTTGKLGKKGGVFPKFKVVQTFRVTNYSALGPLLMLNETRNGITRKRLHGYTYHDGHAAEKHN